jgi:ABC-type antimicrobial peptide transport system permease subunit
VLIDGPSDLDVLNRRLDVVATLDDYGLVLRTPATKADELFEAYDRNRDDRLARSELRRIATDVRERADSDGDQVLTREEVASFFARERRYLSLESRGLLVPSVVIDAAERATSATGLTASPVLAHLVNELTVGERSVVYSIVVAVDLSNLLVRDEEIMLTPWLAMRVGAKPGDPITLSYYLSESRDGVLPTDATTLVMSRISLPFYDAGWTPQLAGITDADTMADWDPPFPGFIDTKRISKDDEAFWERYRAAPKAFVTLATGRRLWGSRFGETTSVRFQAPPDVDIEADVIQLTTALRSELEPEQLGLFFRPVRAEGIAASRGGTDFSQIFMGLSFFLIASAALLVGLLFRLSIEQRVRQVGLLTATGFPPRVVRRLLLAEGLVIAAFAGLVGVGVGIGYGALMIQGLTSWWVDAIRTPFLRLVLTPQTLVIGYLAGVMVAAGSIAWAVRIVSRVPPPALLAGRAVVVSTTTRRNAGRRARRVAIGAGVVAVLGLLTAGLTDAVPDVAAFGLSGAAALCATLALVAAVLGKDHAASTLRSGPWVLIRLGIRNATRNTSRTVLTASLIATATFLIVVVASNRHETGSDVYAKDAGTGGFRLVAASSTPLFHTLATAAGRRSLNIPEQDDAILDRATVYPFRLRPGEDASCLNLYKPDEPRIVAATGAFIERGGFSFASSLAESAEDKENPWRLLDADLGEDVIPAVGDFNTVQWILHLGLGEELTIQDDHGRTVRLRLVGLLAGSILQSELVVSETRFKAHFAGARFFLIDAADEADAQAVERVLDAALGDYGFDATDTGGRLADYKSIENTYLDTFRVLGGLGLLLGTVGMGAVLMRNVFERRSELALMRAVGFSPGRLKRIVMAEHGFVLVLGLAAGTISAGLAVAPHVVGPSGGVPWRALAELLSMVAVVGLLTGAIAATLTLRTPLVASLRSE